MNSFKPSFELSLPFVIKAPKVLDIEENSQEIPLTLNGNKIQNMERKQLESMFEIKNITQNCEQGIIQITEYVGPLEGSPKRSEMSFRLNLQEMGVEKWAELSNEYQQDVVRVVNQNPYFWKFKYMRYQIWYLVVNLWNKGEKKRNSLLNLVDYLDLTTQETVFHNNII